MEQDFGRLLWCVFGVDLIPTGVKYSDVRYRESVYVFVSTWPTWTKKDLMLVVAKLQF